MSGDAAAAPRASAAASAPTIASELRYFVVDTFTDKRFTGNPAAVCLMTNAVPARSPEQTLMLQRIAQEIASVEVAFVFAPASRASKADFSLRFFTSKTETAFCGHAAMAAAQVIFATFDAFSCSTEVQFMCADQSLVVVRRVPGAREGSSPRLELSLKPTLPVRVVVDGDGSSKTIDALRSSVASALSVGAEHIDALWSHASSRNLIVVMKSVAGVLGCKPKRNDVLQVLGAQFAKLTVTAAVSTNDGASDFAAYDIVSRLFAPAIGIDEDACSGSSHAVLAILWRSIEPARFGKAERLMARQASARGGDMTLTFRGARVGVSGGAVMSAVGRIMLPAKL